MKRILFILCTLLPIGIMAQDTIDCVCILEIDSIAPDNIIQDGDSLGCIEPEWIEFDDPNVADKEGERPRLGPVIVLVETPDEPFVNEDDVFQVVQEMPEFPGGMEKLLEYEDKKIKYPAKARKEGIEGMVIVEFIVEKDGSISGPKVILSLTPKCDAEALRVVKSMPKWKPGKQNGKIVRVKYTLPVRFKLKK
ncbi:MAG: energy transducer TonB [Bacteroidaceae bacterium]|nr:energy transducer TonB [Bacteroidaceae bacterium]